MLFGLIGALISAASEQLHRARRQIEQQNRVLAREAQARADAEQGATSERRVADRAQTLLAAVVESSEDAILTKSARRPHPVVERRRRADVRLPGR